MKLEEKYLTEKVTWKKWTKKDRDKAARKLPKNVEYEHCSFCYGAGSDMNYRKCKKCNGTGKETKKEDVIFGYSGGRMTGRSW